MKRVAVFVDAGYLFAQGSALLAGREKRPRSEISLDASAIVARLKTDACRVAPNAELLRIYWYDGALGGTRPTSDQATLARQDNVKLRLGSVNSSGQQKGVDSLIVTDLIELARLNSICDAVLLAGDEDVRIGVQIAQSYGVRVHLIGIEPSRGSQSPQLIEEADTTLEWGKSDVQPVMTLRMMSAASPAPVQTNVQGSDGPRTEPVAAAEAQSQALHENAIETTVRQYTDKLLDNDLQDILNYWKSERGVPAEHDKQLLLSCSLVLGSRLDGTQKKQMRKIFRTNVLARTSSNGTSG